MEEMEDLETEDIYKIDSVIGEDGKRNWDLLRQQVYKKYSREEMQDQLVQFKDNNLDLTILNDAGKSLSKLCITFFREEQYKAKNARAQYSPDEVLQSDELLEKAFEKIDAKPTYYAAGSDYKNFISFITNEASMVSKVAIFSPNLARKIYEKYCPKFFANIHDSSCVDNETEYFNGYEWKSLKDYAEGDKVLQYNEDGTSELVEPIEYIHFKNDDTFYEHNNYETSQCLTGDHRVIYKDGTLKETLVKEIVGKDFQGRIPTTFKYYGDVSVDEKIIKLAVAVQVAAFKTVDEFGKWTLKIAGHKKIERMKEVFDEHIIPYNRETNRNDTIFTFTCKELQNIFKNNIKEFPKSWYNLDMESKETLIDEITKWFNAENCYITSNKANAEFMYYMINSSGKSAYISTKTNENGKVFYKVDIRYYTTTMYNRKWELVDKEDKYCFVVPSHMLVLRRHGLTFITGNCGWGNRCQGAMTSKWEYNYYGTDPNSALHPHYKEQADFIRETLHTNNITDFRCCGSEEFIPEWEGKMDLSFTSPPYFNTEKYSSELTQSAAKCANYYSWRDEFMRPTIKNVYRYLKPGAYYLLNLKNLTPSFGSFPALNDWAIVAQQEGFILEDVTIMYYQSSRQFGTSKKTGKKREVKFTGDKEPVLVLRKPLVEGENKRIVMLYPNTLDKTWENRNKKGSRK